MFKTAFFGMASFFTVIAADFNKRRRFTTGVYWCFCSVSVSVLTSFGNTAKQREKTEKINIKPDYNFRYILTSYSIHLNTQKHRNLLDNTNKNLYTFSDVEGTYNTEQITTNRTSQRGRNYTKFISRESIHYDQYNDIF